MLWRFTALNLDGGGSTSLVDSDGHGGTVSINRPSGGAERYDANHLGGFALPRVTPEPASFALVLIALPAGLLIRRVKQPRG